jgi:hypothetical protein
MKLSEFATLGAAKLHPVRTLKNPDERMLNERGIFALIGMQDGEALMQAIEASPDIPARVKAWFKPSEQGIDISNTSALSILAGMVYANVLTQVNSDILSEYAYLTTQPFINATEHDFQLDFDSQTRFKSVLDSSINEGYLILNWTGIFENHRPQVYIEKGGKKRRIGGFITITKAGEYDCFVGNNKDLFVDDVYGAIV